jgi:hypothetical protein
METNNNYISVLPPLYSRWMEQLLGGPIPPESDATCAKCAMLRPDEGDVCRNLFYFRADTSAAPMCPNCRTSLWGRH